MPSTTPTTEQTKRSKGRPSKPINHNINPQAIRLRQFREKYVNKKQVVAAEMLGVPQNSLSKMENGINPVRMSLVTTLVNKFNLNSEWMATGNGPMKTKDAPKTNLATDLGAINTQVAQLQKLIKFMESGNSFLLKKMGDMQEEMSRMEDRIAQLEAKQR